jgi:hypothetical protein
MATPTILIVPDRFKSGVLYSQLPESGAVDFDVTRATTAFRTNASGILESVASGVPRLDYPAAGGCPALLVEPAATNLALRSEDFTASGFWALTNATITANNDIAPDGTMTADTLTATALGGQVQGAILGVSGTTYTASFFIKRRTGTGVVNIRSVENLSTPITVTNNWTRVSLAATATSTTVRIGIQLGTSGDAVDIWGAQLETGSVATSYIPTTTAAVTRLADVASKGSISSLVNNSEGTLYFEVLFDKLYDAGGSGPSGLEIGDGGNFANIISIGVVRGTTNQIFVFNINASTNVIVNSINITSVGIYKCAFSYDANGNSFYVNGALLSNYTAGSSSTAAIVNSFSRLTLGGFWNGSTALSQNNDGIISAALYPTRLSNSELAALTSL